MTAGYSKTPLLRKLGIKPGTTFMPVHEPDHYFDLLGELPMGVKLVRQGNPDSTDCIHLFARDEAILHAAFPPLKENLHKDGMIWVSWIKKSSTIETDIAKSNVRRLGLDLGLVDVKICAVDEDWSALKFVYSKEDR